MSFKTFKAQDLIYNVIVAKPTVNFSIHSGTVHYQRERLPSSTFTADKPNIKHIDQGHVSLHEMNIDREQNSFVYSYVEKGSTRYAHKQFLLAILMMQISLVRETK